MQRGSASYRGSNPEARAPPREVNDTSAFGFGH